MDEDAAEEEDDDNGVDDAGDAGASGLGLTSAHWGEGEQRLGEKVCV